MSRPRESQKSISDLERSRDERRHRLAQAIGRLLARKWLKEHRESMSGSDPKLKNSSKSGT